MEEKKDRKQQTELEFLAEWERYHRKPKEEALQAGWLKEREQALGYFRVAQEKKEKELRKSAEEEQHRNLILDQIYYKKKTGNPDIQLPPFLPGVSPFTEKQFDMTDFSEGMAMLTTLACLNHIGELAELAERLTTASKVQPPEKEYEKLWKDMASRHKEDVIALRQMSQRGRNNLLVDKVQSSMEQMMRASLTPDLKQMKLLDFVAEQLRKTVYTMDDSKDPELQAFRKAFKERDRSKLMLKFNALSRMTVLLNYYEAVLEKLKKPEFQREQLSQQELKDLVLGAYVSRELKKSIEQKALTKGALRLGTLRMEQLGEQGKKLHYGDEEILKELKKQDFYRELSGMTVREVASVMKKRDGCEKHTAKVRKNEKRPMHRKIENR